MKRSEFFVCKRYFASALLAAMLCLPTFAHAQETNGAPGHYLLLREGIALLRQNRVAEAIERMERALDLYPAPLTFYNLGLAYRAAGRTRDVFIVWRHYAQAPEPNVSAERLRAVREELSTLQRSLAQVTIEPSPSDATVEIPGVHQRTMQVEQQGEQRRVNVWLAPGAYELTLQRQGYRPHRRSLNVIAGSTQTLALQMEAEPPPPPPQPPPPPDPVPIPPPPPPAPIVVPTPQPWSPPWWSWVSLGVGVAGTITSVGLGIHGTVLADDWNRRCGGMNESNCELERLALQPRLEGYTAGIFVAGTLGLAGFATFAGSFLWRRPNATTTVALRTNSVGLAVHW